jgi:ribosomal protein S18 acetylase RimI-like enzyme
MEPLRIRRATMTDLDAIATHNLAIARETEGASLDRELVTEGVCAVLEESRGATRGTYFVAERDDAIVGQLLVTHEWSDWRNGWYWWIQSVYVAPRARRSGVYRALHAHVVEHARRAADVLAIKLYVDRDNRAARDTYAALGMKHARYDLYEIDLNRG